MVEKLGLAANTVTLQQVIDKMPNGSVLFDTVDASRFVGKTPGPTGSLFFCRITSTRKVIIFCSKTFVTYRARFDEDGKFTGQWYSLNTTLVK